MRTMMIVSKQDVFAENELPKKCLVIFFSIFLLRFMLALHYFKLLLKFFKKKLN